MVVRANVLMKPWSESECSAVKICVRAPQATTSERKVAYTESVRSGGRERVTQSQSGCAGLNIVCCRV